MQKSGSTETGRNAFFLSSENADFRNDPSRFRQLLSANIHRQVTFDSTSQPFATNSTSRLPIVGDVEDGDVTVQPPPPRRRLPSTPSSPVDTTASPTATVHADDGTYRRPERVFSKFQKCRLSKRPVRISATSVSQHSSPGNF